MYFFCNYISQRKLIPVAKAKCHTSPRSGSDSPSHGFLGQGNRSLPYTQNRINGLLLYECNFCLKTMSTLGSINSHVRVHTGERPFKCQVCGKSFNQNHNLKNHLRVHTGEKPFGCDICQKRFGRQSDLKLHTFLHTNERPYKCRGCQMKYVSVHRMCNHWKTSNCEPHSIEECSPTDSNGSDVEGNYLIGKQFQ